MSTRWGSGAWTAVTLGVLAVAAVAIAREASEPSARERAQTEIARQPLACDGPRTRTRDPLRDVRWSPGGLGMRVDQDAATGDVRAASLSVAGDALCLEVELREPVPSRLDVHLSVHQRQPAGYDASSGALVELDDRIAVGVRDVGNESVGMRTVWYRVRASVADDTIRVLIPAREVEWRLVSVDRPFRWNGETIANVEGHAEQQADWTRWVRHGARRP